MIKNPSGKILLKWAHGLGDSVMFTVVLQHLRETYPSLTIEKFRDILVFPYLSIINHLFPQKEREVT